MIFWGIYCLQNNVQKSRTPGRGIQTIRKYAIKSWPLTIIRIKDVIVNLMVKLTIKVINVDMSFYLCYF